MEGEREGGRGLPLGGHFALRLHPFETAVLRAGISVRRIGSKDAAITTQRQDRKSNTNAKQSL